MLSELNEKEKAQQVSQRRFPAAVLRWKKEASLMREEGLCRKLKKEPEK